MTKPQIPRSASTSLPLEPTGVPESGQPIHLSAAEETELLEAMEQIRRGEYVDGDVLLNELRSGLSD